MTDDNAKGETIAAEAKAALEDGLDNAVEFAKRQWRDNPALVVAAAAGAGLLIGLLLGRRR